MFAQKGKNSRPVVFVQQWLIFSEKSKVEYRDCTASIHVSGSNEMPYISFEFPNDKSDLSPVFRASPPTETCIFFLHSIARKHGAAVCGSNYARVTCRRRTIITMFFVLRSGLCSTRMHYTLSRRRRPAGRSHSRTRHADPGDRADAG